MDIERRSNATHQILLRLVPVLQRQGEALAPEIGACRFVTQRQHQVKRLARFEAACIEDELFPRALQRAVRGRAGPVPDMPFPKPHEAGDQFTPETLSEVVSLWVAAGQHKGSDR